MFVVIEAEIGSGTNNIFFLPKLSIFLHF